MLEVFDTAAARDALARRKLRCPDCGQDLRPWGRARARSVRELGGALLTIRPDRAQCTGCQVTHIVLDAGLLPRRAHSAALIGRNGSPSATPARLSTAAPSTPAAASPAPAAPAAAVMCRSMTAPSPPPPSGSPARTPTPP